MKKIVVIGEILVEIMADTVGEGFRAPIALTGPYPSGAPAIFVSQTARLGQTCAIVSAVGEDDFGTSTLERLAADGVDVSGVGVDPDRPTGSAFVRYRADGGRDFVFNIRHSACGTVGPATAPREALGGADHLHVMGSSLSTPGFVALILETARNVKARGGTVSFDPNLRVEMLDDPGLREAMSEILSLTDVFLPSGAELTLLTEARDEVGAIAELRARGMTVVHKKGSGGATLHDRHGALHQAAFPAQEVDPTGAGDCFGSAFVVLWLRGADRTEALRLAAAAGALAVSVRGPMEGAGEMAALRKLADRAES